MHGTKRVEMRVRRKYKKNKKEKRVVWIICFTRVQLSTINR